MTKVAGCEAHGGRVRGRSVPLMVVRVAALTVLLMSLIVIALVGGGRVERCAQHDAVGSAHWDLLLGLPGL